eukprot:1071427-Prorocentrum_minimum.AAC.1
MSNKTPNGGCECVKLRGIERFRLTSFTLNTSRHGSGGGSLGTSCDADRTFARSARYDRGARPISVVPKYHTYEL